MGLMFLALRDGIPQAATAQGVPERTLRNFFTEDGQTVADVRRWLDEEVLDSFARMRQGIFDEVRDRKGNLTEKGLLRALEAVIPKESPSTAPAAAAQANVYNITLTENDG